MPASSCYPIESETETDPTFDHECICPCCYRTKTHKLRSTKCQPKRIVQLLCRRQVLRETATASGSSSNNDTTRSLLVPLTRKHPQTGEYTVYKGYCLKPTCYTLSQAKTLLGEADPDSNSLDDLIKALSEGDGSNVPKKILLDNEPDVTNDSLHNLCGAIVKATKKSIKRQSDQENNADDNGSKVANKNDAKKEGLLEQLSLCFNQRLTHTLPLATLLGATQGLTKLQLDGCPIGDTGASALFETLQFNKDIRLQYLSLSHCSLKATKYIRVSLKENKSLKCLILHKCVHQPPITSRSNTNANINFQQNVFSCQSVANFVRDTGESLEILSLPPASDERLEEEDTTMLLPSAMLQNRHLRELHLSGPSKELTMEIALAFLSTETEEQQNKMHPLRIAGLNCRLLHDFGLSSALEARLIWSASLADEECHSVASSLSSAESVVGMSPSISRSSSSLSSDASNSNAEHHGNVITLRDVHNKLEYCTWEPPRAFIASAASPQQMASEGKTTDQRDIAQNAMPQTPRRLVVSKQIGVGGHATQNDAASQASPTLSQQISPKDEAVDKRDITPKVRNAGRRASAPSLTSQDFTLCQLPRRLGTAKKVGNTVRAAPNDVAYTRKKPMTWKEAPSPLVVTQPMGQRKVAPSPMPQRKKMLAPHPPCEYGSDPNSQSKRLRRSQNRKLGVFQEYQSSSDCQMRYHNEITFHDECKTNDDGKPTFLPCLPKFESMPYVPIFEPDRHFHSGNRQHNDSASKNDSCGDAISQDVVAQWECAQKRLVFANFDQSPPPKKSTWKPPYCPPCATISTKRCNGNVATELQPRFGI